MGRHASIRLATNPCPAVPGGPASCAENTARAVQPPGPRDARRDQRPEDVLDDLFFLPPQARIATGRGGTTRPIGIPAAPSRVGQHAAIGNRHGTRRIHPAQRRRTRRRSRPFCQLPRSPCRLRAETISVSSNGSRLAGARLSRSADNTPPPVLKRLIKKRGGCGGLAVAADTPSPPVLKRVPKRDGSGVADWRHRRRRPGLTTHGGSWCGPTQPRPPRPPSCCSPAPNRATKETLSRLPTQPAGRLFG